MRAIAARRLHYAIAVSLALHILALWPTGLRVLMQEAPSVLHATLKSPPSPAPVARARPPDRAVVPAPTPEASAPKALQPTSDQSSALSVPLAATSPAPLTRSLPTFEVADAATAPPSVAASAASSVLLTEANASGEAMDGLRGYRLAVASQARRFKRYPAQAMTSGWQGSADIRVEIGSDGRPHAARLARSSGHELLDRAALAMIDAGALRARLPESLRGKSFAIVLPVVFNLDDE